MIKIYAKNNYIVVEKDGIALYAPSKTVNVIPLNAELTKFKITGLQLPDKLVTEQPLDFSNVDLSDLVDVNETDYTVETFVEFFTANTGNFNQGSAFDPQILAALSNANSPSSVNPYATVNDIGNSTIAEYNTQINIKNIGELLSLHPANGNNEIQLAHKTYKFDADEFDMTGYTLLGHNDGTTLSGYSQNINCLKSTQDNISLIKTSGNLFIKHLEIQVTGANSEAINMNGATGFESIDMFYSSFINCKKLGTLSNIRQFFWEAGFANNFDAGFLCQGDWLGGITVKDTRCVNVQSYIFKGDAGFTCSAIRSNISAALLTGSYAFDFDYDMFNNDAAYQLEGGRYEGTGKMVSNFTTGDTTIAKNSKKSFFKNNKGNLGENTFVGIEWVISTEVETPLDFNVLT